MTQPEPARLLAGGRGDGLPLSLGQHLQVHGPPPPPERDRGRSLRAAVAQAGLRGRGGAGFPTAAKLEAVAAQRRGPVGTQRRRPLVVANGVEAEPASAKDRTLLARSPHLVLDGAVLAARSLGADRAIVAVHPEVLRVVEEALAERRANGVDPLPVVTAVPPRRFVAGEETALVHWLDRGVATPTARPPHPAERGLMGRPTLVQNVETLAHLALIARHGPAWFRRLGPAGDPGTTLVTLWGAVARPGVYEVELGRSLDRLLALAGGETEPVQAYLVGGYAGTWLPAPAARGVPLSRDPAASQAGGPSATPLGAGVIVALPAAACGLTETARVAAYLARETASQCGPCRFGLPAVAGALQDLGRPGALPDLGRWLAQVEGRGACRHPDGAVRLVRSALVAFGQEVDRHRLGWCSASVAGTAVGA